jgi:hypothetical protein
MHTPSRHSFLASAMIALTLATGCAAMSLTGALHGPTASTASTASTATSQVTTAGTTSPPSSPDESDAAIKLRRAIERTSDVIMTVAFAIEKIHPEPDFLDAVSELRKAMVLNAAARRASTTQPPRVAMFLTLEARKLMKAMMDDHHGNAAEAEPAELEAAVGGAGADAERAIGEADRIVPSLATISDPALRQRTTAFPDLVFAAETAPNAR